MLNSCHAREETIYLASFIALSYIIISLIWDLYFSPTQAIPGPWPSRFSRLWFFNKVRAGSFHLENIALHDKYGPLVRVAPNHFSISTPDRAIYGIGSKFPKSDWYQGWKTPSPDRGTLFPEQDIKRHAETRKKFQSLYSMSTLLSYEIYVDDCIDIFFQKLRQFARSGETMDLSHWFQCYAFDVVGEITYSERLGFLDNGDDIAGTMAALHQSMMYSTLVGIFPKLHPILYKIMGKIPGSGPAGYKYLMGFVQRKIDERNRSRKQQFPHPQTRTSNDAVTPQDFLDKMLESKEQNPEKVTPWHIFMMGLSNIAAGADTTAISLSSIAFNLINSPDVLSKLRQELAEHGVWNRRITFKESQEMPYLQAVIKEALRIHPVTGLPLWRVVPEGGVLIGEHWLPPGTNIGANSWVSHYNKSIFGDDAHVFRPDRWEEAKEQGGDRLKKMEASYMPFGVGTRTCIGRHISILEMSKLIPEIVKNFDLTLKTPKEEWKSINYWFVKPESFPVTVNHIRGL